MNCAGARKPPRNGLRCIAPGTGWVAAAPARCFTGTSRRTSNGSITCDNCASCRMRREALPALFLSPSSRRARPSPTSNAATAFEQLRNLAVSRIYLDNFEHLTAYWVSMGLPLAQVALSYGVDDLHGTIMRGKNFPHGRRTTPQEQTVEALRSRDTRRGPRTGPARQFLQSPHAWETRTPTARARGRRRTSLRLMWPP